MKKLLFAVFTASLLLAACQKQLDYKLNLPVYEVTDLQPADNAVLDLNDIDKNEYKFSWEVAEPADQVLLVSTDPMLANSLSIEVGKATSHTLTALELDLLFVKLGITAGKEKTLYWSVKDKTRPDMASRQINTLTGRRAVSKLIAPLDLAQCTVYREELDKTLEFSWNAEGMDAAETYTLCFSLSQDFSGKTIEVEVGSANPTTLTYTRMQEIYEGMELPQFETAVMYWNVKVDSKDIFLSRSSSILYLDGILEFTDVRGDETITYRVTKIRYPNGRTVIWLADNFKSLKYPDGTDIAATDYILNTKADVTPEQAAAYGPLYAISISKKVAPKGWRVPSVGDYEELFREAAKSLGRDPAVVQKESKPAEYNILKDEKWYGTFPREKGHINEWRLNLNTPGRWPDSVYEIWNYNQMYCYLIASDMPDRVINHDNDGQLWYSVNRGAALRLIYVGNK